MHLLQALWRAGRGRLARRLPPFHGCAPVLGLPPLLRVCRPRHGDLRARGERRAAARPACEAARTRAAHNHGTAHAPHRTAQRPAAPEGCPPRNLWRRLRPTRSALPTGEDERAGPAVARGAHQLRGRAPWAGGWAACRRPHPPCPRPWRASRTARHHARGCRRVGWPAGALHARAGALSPRPPRALTLVSLPARPRPPAPRSARTGSPGAWWVGSVPLPAPPRPSALRRADNPAHAPSPRACTATRRGAAPERPAACRPGPASLRLPPTPARLLRARKTGGSSQPLGPVTSACTRRGGSSSRRHPRPRPAAPARRARAHAPRAALLTCATAGAGGAPAAAAAICAQRRGRVRRRKPWARGDAPPLRARVGSEAARETAPAFPR